MFWAKNNSPIFSFILYLFLSLSGFTALILPVQADAPNTEAATVLFSHGNVVLTNNASSYPLGKGHKVAAGDTIITGENGRVQLRFTDGGLVSLMPNSEFVVNEYSQPTASDEGSVSLKLLKGGLRALSGSIGSKDEDSYELKTDVATLGIRGTQFIVLMDGNIMRVHVGEGAVILFNNLGTLFVPSGYHAEVLPGKAPVLTANAPALGAAVKPEAPTEEENEEDKKPADEDIAHIDTEVPEDSSTPERNIDVSTSQGSEKGTVIVLDEDGNLQSVIVSVNDGSYTVSQEAPDPVTGQIHPTTYNSGIVNNRVEQHRNYTVTPGAGVNHPHQTTPPATFYTSGENLKALGYEDAPAVKLGLVNDINDATLVGGLYWAERLTDKEEDLQGTLRQYYGHYAVVWGDPATNVPLEGTLNYKLAGGSPVRDIYNQADDNVLTKFDLEVQLGSQAKFKAEVETTKWSFSQSQAVIEDVSHAPNSFKFTAGNNNGCSGCMLAVGGFFSGDQAAQAGVSYHYIDATNTNAPEHGGGPVNYTGVAVLDRQ